MNENDRRILTKACDLPFYKWEDPWFDTADDWELVRVHVIVPNQEAFVVFLWSEETWPLNKWIALSCERKCQYAADFIKSRPDLFPWAVEMEE